MAKKLPPIASTSVKLYLDSSSYFKAAKTLFAKKLDFKQSVTFGNVFSSGAGKLQGTFDSITNNLGAFSGTLGGVVSLAGKAVSGVADLIGSAISGTADLLSSTLGGIVGLIPGIGGSLSGMLKGVIGTLGDLLGGVVKSLGSAVGAIASALGGVLDAVLGQLKIVAGIAFTAVAYGLYKSVTSASDLNEQLEYSKQRWGENSEAVQSYVNSLASAYGASKTLSYQTLNMFGGILMDTGIASKDVLSLSKNLVLLGNHIASARNLSVEDAFGKIGSALTGQNKPLKEIGVDIDVAAVKAEALKLGLMKVGEEMSNADQATATISLLMRKFSVDMGDLDRTAGSFSNQTRKLWGQLDNLASTIGARLLPPISKFISYLNDMVASAQTAAEGSLPFFDLIVKKLDSAVEAIGVVLRNLGPYWDMAKLYAGTFAEYTQTVFSSVVKNILEAFEWLRGNWGNLAQQLGQMLADGIAKGTQAALGHLDKFVAVGGIRLTDMMKVLTLQKGAKADALMHMLDNVGFGGGAVVNNVPSVPKLPDFKLPELKMPDISALNRTIADNEKAFREKTAKIPVVKADDIDFAGVGKRATEDAEKKKEKKTAQYSDASEFYKKLQEGALNKKNPVVESNIILRDILASITASPITSKLQEGLKTIESKMGFSLNDVAKWIGNAPAKVNEMEKNNAEKLQKQTVEVLEKIYGKVGNAVVGVMGI